MKNCLSGGGEGGAVLEEEEGNRGASHEGGVYKGRGCCQGRLDSLNKTVKVTRTTLRYN